MAESKARSDAEQVVSVVVSGVTGMILGGLTVHSPELAATLPAAGSAAAILLTWFGFDKLGRASESYSAGFRRIVGRTPDPDEVRRRAKSDPGFRDRVHATLRELEASLDIETAPAFGALAAEYAWPDPPRPPDAFFRGALKLLRSIAGGELNALQTMCEALAQLDLPANSEALSLFHMVPAPGELPELTWDEPDPAQPGRTLGHLPTTEGGAWDGRARRSRRRHLRAASPRAAVREPPPAAHDRWAAPSGEPAPFRRMIRPGRA
jgi:hypothetical protein